MMTSRQRLMAMLDRARPDRPGLNFYEIGGFNIDPSDPDPFNIYNSPDWAPLIELAEINTDLIRIRNPGCTASKDSRRYEFTKIKNWLTDKSRFTMTEIAANGRDLRQLVRRDRDVLTDWTIEHFCKDIDDLNAYLSLPDEVFFERWDVDDILNAETLVGDRGIVMIDTPDPLCMAAQLFAMDMFVMAAFEETRLFESLLEKFAKYLYARTEFVSKAAPGRLWRIYGPEYATEPYLSPELFRRYVVKYTGPMIDIIKRNGGYVRIHSHGRIKNILPMIVEMGADAIDPIEPPPQGDVELDWVQREYGRDIVLFGNIEITDIENLESARFKETVLKTIKQGVCCPGRGFVLLPSAAPYGRHIKANVLENYRIMVKLIKEV